ncbi:MAG: hypothetical protein K0Q49_574, partial [Haloplasmataceae bacterium]|nr:hypothetical protein [Haloplasmataceae bacterium]
GLLTGCNKQTSTITNTTNSSTTAITTVKVDIYKPLLKINAYENEVKINQGEDFDFLRGITGFDNVDGNLTNKIEVSLGDFDKNVPGVYEIFYFLVDNAGNAADSLTRIITVIDTTIYPAPSVFLEDISNEAAKPIVPGCAPGSWYHKVVSSRDVWSGAEGIVTLPEFSITRYQDDLYNPDEFLVDPSAINLDNPSVYMGGNASAESDIGLSYSRVCIGSNCETLTNGSAAFRPYWRYVTTTDYDYEGEGGYDGYSVSCTANGRFRNCWGGWDKKDTQYYYLPGDKLRMIVYSPKPHFLQLQIEVLEKSTIDRSVKMREAYGWKDPENFKSPIFSSPGQGMNTPAEFKRVNAIDHVNHSGLPAADTTSFVNTATWHEFYLYRKINSTMYRVPMTEERSGVLTCPIADRFTVNKDNLDASLGGENIQIHPSTTSPINNQVNMTYTIQKKEEDLVIIQ